MLDENCWKTFTYLYLKPMNLTYEHVSYTYALLYGHVGANMKP